MPCGIDFQKTHPEKKKKNLMYLKPMTLYWNIVILLCISCSIWHVASCTEETRGIFLYVDISHIYKENELHMLVSSTWSCSGLINVLQRSSFVSCGLTKIPDWISGVTWVIHHSSYSWFLVSLCWCVQGKAVYFVHALYSEVANDQVVNRYENPR